ncbi:MAG: class I SAM-dependent methyltransferase [Paracoccaceae bacterium]
MSNEEQAKLWGNDMGRAWLREEAALDAMLESAMDLLFESARIAAGDRVLDIGCGTGPTTLRAALAAGPGGAAVGADISPLLVERARELAAGAGIGNATFRVSDAATDDFGGTPFDRVISRMGVQFFADPGAAFTNIARALRPGRRMTFVCWAGPEGNPWFSVPGRIASAHFGAPSGPGNPRAPGALAFAEIGYVTGILRDAGLADVSGATAAVGLNGGSDLDELAAFSTRLGPASRIIRECGGSEADKIAIQSRVAEAFAAFRQGDRMLIPATLTLYSARRPG